MSDNLKRIIIISIVNGLALYYIHKLLEKGNVLPPLPTNNDQK